MRIDLTERERAFLEQMIAESMERLGKAIDAHADKPQSETVLQLGPHLGFLNGIAAKLCRPPELSDEERKLAEVGGDDGVLSGDIRHLIDWLWLGGDE